MKPAKRKHAETPQKGRRRKRNLTSTPRVIGKFASRPKRIKQYESSKELKMEEQSRSSKQTSGKCSADDTDSSFKSTETPEETGKVRALIAQWQKLTEKVKPIDKRSDNIKIGFAKRAVQNVITIPAKEDVEIELAERAAQNAITIPAKEDIEIELAERAAQNVITIQAKEDIEIELAERAAQNVITIQAKEDIEIELAERAAQNVITIQAKEDIEIELAERAAQNVITIPAKEDIEIDYAERAAQNVIIIPPEEDTDKVNAIQRVFSDLVEYMEPEPILDLFMTSGLFKISQIRDIMDITSTSDKTRLLLKRVMQRSGVVYTKFKEYLKDTNQSHLVTLLEMTERRENTTEIRKEISQTSIAASRSPYRMACKELQGDLVKYYRECHSKISVSPLILGNDVPLEEFYVQPPIVAIDLQRRYGKPTKTPVKSYKQLLYRDDDSTYKNIYVTADAGVGKTAFTRKLCAMWCQAHSPMTSLASKYDDDDISAARYFELLFLIPLRDADRSLCDLDEQIISFIKENLPRRHTRKMLDKILEESTCLIIIDGLDEWSHSEACSRRRLDHDIPHRKRRPNWTILSTTRPWKFDMLSLASHEVDRHVEIKELDKESSEHLVSNAINLLNLQLEKDQPKKSLKDFNQTTSSKKLGDIRQVPYIYLQSVCLWFEGNDIGSSKCAIYTNVMELTLKRGIQKQKPGTTLLKQEEDSRINVPKCMIGKKYCIQHLTLLLKLGKLAFFTLFGTENRQLLVFDITVAEKYLTIQELEFCLQMGILTQNKGYGSVATKKSYISFLHKSLHEFFTAFYMQSDDKGPGKQYVLDLVNKTCTTLSSILEMSNVFIFVSGLGPTVYSDLSQTIMKHVTLDEQTSKYRTHISSFVLTTKSVYESSVKFQTLQVECVEEMLANGHDFHSFPIQDIVINDTLIQTEYLSVLQKLLHGNRADIKSLSVFSIRCKSTDEVTNILETLDVQNFLSLDKLALIAVVREPDVEQLLSQSKSTLQYLCLSYATHDGRTYKYERTVLSKVCEDMILSMPLQGLCLESLIVTHEQLESLTTFLTSRVTMTQIDLEHITCSDHRESCPGIDFHLSEHENLQVFGLNNVPVSQLEVKTQLLEECYIGGCFPGVIRFSLTCLAAANSLRILGLENLTGTSLSVIIETIPELLQLEELVIVRTDLSDNSPVMTKNMTRLRSIELQRVSMTSSALRTLSRTVSTMSQSVEILLFDCKVTPEAEYETVKNEIRRSTSFTVTSDDNEDFYYRTLKNNSLITHNI